MNMIVTGISVSIVLSSISAITAASNGMYSLIGNIKKSTASHYNDIVNCITRNDIETRVRTIMLILKELKIDESTPYTTRYCIVQIHEAIEDIAQELSDIQYRLTYNNSLWIGSSVRSYKFHNSATRMNAKMSVLNSRYGMLRDTTKMIANGLISINHEIPRLYGAEKFETNRIVNVNAERLLLENTKKINNNALQITDKNRDKEEIPLLTMGEYIE